MSVFSHGIPLKKKYGQHFLRDQHIIDTIINAVKLEATSSVFEIGCGDGFLTKSIIKTPIARLWVFEIDEEWVQYVRSLISDKRLTIFHENILDVDFSRFEPYKPWTLLANLPYQVTFPILHVLQRNRHLLKEGVVMVQEEVAEKIVKKSGKGYGYVSLFFQYYFEWKMLTKISPGAFFPPPKVYSRLLYFKPKDNLEPIAQEERFWSFIKTCFRQPRRTLKNNLAQTQIDLERIPEQYLLLRAQQMTMNDFLEIWHIILA